MAIGARLKKDTGEFEVKELVEGAGIKMGKDGVFTALEIDEVNYTNIPLKLGKDGVVVAKEFSEFLA